MKNKVKAQTGQHKDDCYSNKQTNGKQKLMMPKTEGPTKFDR